MPLLLEFLAKLDEVVDFTVDDGRNRLVLVGHRLGALRSEVDDREAPMSERARSIRPEPLVVRPSVNNTTAHAVNQVGCNRPSG